MKKETVILNSVIGIMRAQASLLSSLKKSLKQTDINTTEFSILEYLYHKGNNTIENIRKHILITSGSTTYVIDCLEKKGLVKRVQDHQDKRVYVVEISDSGKKLIQDFFPKHVENLQAIFNQFTHEDLKIFNQLLKKLEFKGEQK